MYVKNLVYAEVTGTPYASTVTEITVDDASVFGDPSSVGNYDVTLYNLRKNPGKAFNDGEAAVLLLTGVDAGTNTLTFNTQIGIALSDSIEWAVIHGATEDNWADKADLSGGNTFSGDQRIDGNIGVNKNPSKPLDIIVDGGNADLEIIEYQDNAFSPIVTFRKSRGSQSSPSAVQNSDGLGKFTFYGWDGGSWQIASQFESFVDGSVSSGTIPSGFRFFVGTGGGNPSALIFFNQDGSITSKGLLSEGKITHTSLSADPADPDNGNYVVWVSDGTGSGDDGDVMFKITNSSGTTKTGTLIDYSAV